MPVPRRRAARVRHGSDDSDASTCDTGTGPQLVHIPSDVRSVDVEVGPFLDAALPLLGVAAGGAAPVETPLRPASQWLPAVVQGMREREGLPAEEAPEAPEHDDDLDSSAAQRDSIRGRGIQSFAQLLADALVEIAEEEVKNVEPRGIGWRRRGLGEPPLSRFNAQQAAEGREPLPKTWDGVRSRLEQAVKFGNRPEEPSAVTGTDEDQGAGSGLERTLAEDFDFDSMLAEEIGADEPSWLNIGADLKSVKCQVANLLFEDLVEETIAQIRSMSIG